MKKVFSIFAVCLVLLAVAYAANNPVENLAPTGNLVPLITAIESARLYPVLVLPLGSTYYDFELKATVDNYTNGDLVYFFASAVDVQPTYPVWDAAPKIFFTLASSSDGRVWRTANPTASLYSQVGATSNARLNQVVVIPSQITGSAAWMYKGNTHLVWSYNRITAVGPETDGAGHVVWNPIVPVDWRSAQTTP